MELERKYQEALDFIYSFIDLSVSRDLRYSPERFDLSRMYSLMSKLGDPQLNFEIIHVAGTKGKGSICAMTASILKEAGYKVGFYSSPHMIDFRERIKVNNNNISRRSLVNYVIELRPIFNSIDKLSTFEIITSIAFKYFSKQEIDIAVVEVGMGGRLDATNIVKPIISIISPISYDHMKILGNSIPQIAREKAGIIKKSIPVIISPQIKLAKKEIEKIAIGKESQIIDISQEYSFYQMEYSLKNQTFVIKDKLRKLPDTKNQIYEIPLIGDHQINNAVTAYACAMHLRKLGYHKINEMAIKDGFIKVDWPGRFEIVNQKPLIIVDGAHNRDSISKLGKTIKKYLAAKEVILIFGVSEDKEVELMLKIINPYVDQFIFTKSNHPRALGLSALEKIATDLGLVDFSIEEIGDIISLILSDNEPDKVFIASGSIFIAGTIKQLIEDKGKEKLRV